MKKSKTCVDGVGTRLGGYGYLPGGGNPPPPILVDDYLDACRATSPAHEAKSENRLFVERIFSGSGGFCAGGLVVDMALRVDLVELHRDALRHALFLHR